MMRTLILIVFAINALVIYAKENYAEGLFTTSKCFDLIASLQYFDKIKDAPQFSHLAADSVFMKHLNTINENVTASKLCNFYATFNGNRNDTDSCVLFFRDLNENPLLESEGSDWIKNIVNLQQDLYHCISNLNAAGYSEYWESEIKPTLDKYVRI